jgi:transcriptional regulator with XRE-family HTH domain
MGYTLDAISKWENGYNEPSNEDLLKLCGILETTSDYLLGRTNTNEYYVEISGEQIPKSLRALGLEKVEALKEYIEEYGGLPLEVQQRLLSLIAEANVLLENDDPSR